jgi:hypothetical protein
MLLAGVAERRHGERAGAGNVVVVMPREVHARSGGEVQRRRHEHGGDHYYRRGGGGAGTAGGRDHVGGRAVRSGALAEDAAAVELRSARAIEGSVGVFVVRAGMGGGWSGQ